jgi:hypothetical protein
MVGEDGRERQLKKNAACVADYLMSTTRLVVKDKIMVRGLGG